MAVSSGNSRLISSLKFFFSFPVPISAINNDTLYQNLNLLLLFSYLKLIYRLIDFLLTSSSLSFPNFLKISLELFPITSYPRTQTLR